MKKIVAVGMSLLVAGLVAAGWMSCTSHEPSPEEVEDGFGKEAYFISGRVSFNKDALGDVDVVVDDSDNKVVTKADGTYQLSLHQTGKYTVYFKKDGFIKVVTVAEFAKDIPNRSSLVISPEMTKINEGVTVNPDDEIEITDPTGKAVLRLLRSVAEQTDVSLTVYRGLPTVFSANSVLFPLPHEVSYTTVAVEPEGVELTKQSTLLVNKTTSEAITFATVDLYTRNADASWTKLKETTFNKTRNAYESQISSFSTYSLRIPYTAEVKSTTVSDHTNGSVAVDNCGNIAAREGVAVTVTERCGWAYESDLAGSIRTTCPGISESDVEALSNVLSDQISSLEGSDAGYYDVPVTLSSVNVSGNSVMNYENKAKESVVSYSFDVIFEGKTYKIPVGIRKYTGMDEQYTNKSCYQHSGGQGK